MALEQSEKLSHPESASREGLTPSPTCLPGQGGSRKGMRPDRQRNGSRENQPSSEFRWRVFCCRQLSLHSPSGPAPRRDAHSLFGSAHATTAEQNFPTDARDRTMPCRAPATHPQQRGTSNALQNHQRRSRVGLPNAERTCGLSQKARKERRSRPRHPSALHQIPSGRSGDNSSDRSPIAGSPFAP